MKIILLVFAYIFTLARATAIHLGYDKPKFEHKSKDSLKISGKLPVINVNFNCDLNGRPMKSNNDTRFFSGALSIGDVLDGSCYYTSDIFGVNHGLFSYNIDGVYRTVTFSIKNMVANYSYFDEPLIEDGNRQGDKYSDNQVEWGQIDVAIVALPSFFHSSIIGGNKHELEQFVYAISAVANMIWTSLHISINVRHLLAFNQGGYYMMPKEDSIADIDSFGKFLFDLQLFQKTPFVEQLTKNENSTKKLNFIFLRHDDSEQMVHGAALSTVGCK